MGMHVYIGSQTFSLWQNYDPDFYNALMLPDTSVTGFEVRKFYYIGLTLPDLLDDQNMGIVRGLINTLYAYRDSVVRKSYGSVNVSLDGPLSITDTTYNNVQTHITYPSGELPMNSNFPKTCSMVQYARNRNWGPKYKALIYGCFMHNIQDLYQGMALVPSRFGYGYAIDSDSVLSKVVLGYAEKYYEILSPTHLTETDWRCIEQGLYGARRYENCKVALLGGYFDFYPLWQYYNEAGQMGYEHKLGWQQMNIAYVDSFVKAMNQTFCMNNLTRERLESYLHGWAILMFFIYGHERVGEQNINIGGLLAHPYWYPQQIADFWDDIGDDFFKMRVAPAWFIDLMGYICLPTLYHRIRGYFVGQVTSDILARLPYSNLRNIPQGQQMDWYKYWQTPENLLILQNAVPASEMTPEVSQELARVERNVFYWNQYAQIKKPNLRDSYSEEKNVSVNIQQLYFDAMVNWSNYININMNGVDAFALSRKAGLTGGMYSVPNENYGREPGVLNAGFKKDGNFIWTPITVGLQGDTVCANFFHDLITLGPTRLRVVGKTETGNEIELQPINYNIGDYLDIGRWTGDHPFNLQQAANQGVREIFFRISTKNKYGSDYTEMMSSDYSSQYLSHPEIYNNPLYQQWFKEGNPFRDTSENPFINYNYTVKYWPYACSLNVVDWYINKPTALNANINSQNMFIDLNWTDNSNHEYHFEIKRVKRDYNDSTTFEINGNQGTGLINWTDDSVQVGCVYRYSVRAKREQWYSDWSNPVDYSLTFADSVPITAYNYANKVITFGNNVHLTYFGKNPAGNYERVIYINSPDGGNTWGNIEYVSPSEPGLCGMFPAIACDSLGNPYIIWAIKWQWHCDVPPGEGPLRNHWETHYYLAKKVNGQWRNYHKFTFTVNDPNGEHRPRFELLQPSFAIKNDTGFIAFVMTDTSGQNHNLWLGKFTLDSLPGYSWKYPLGSYSGENYPSILVDRDGRIVVTLSLGNAIKIWYIDSQKDSITINNLGSVHNLSASLEQGKNILLTWVDMSGVGAIKFRRLVKQSNGSYQASMTETIVTDMCALDVVHPKIVNINLYPCLILYEGCYQPNGTYCIFYAFRLGENRWRVRPVNSESNLLQSIYPQGFISGNRLTTYWTGTDGTCLPNNNYNSPLYLRSKNVNLLPDLLSTFYVACDIATGPNNGTHLMRVPNTKELYMVYQEQNTIYCSHSKDEGINWEIEQIGEGQYPCIGLNYKGRPWIAYVNNGDLICKMARLDGSYKDTILFDGDENYFAGPPSMALATMPIKEGVLDYAYVTYPVYQGTMPDNPCPQPPENINNCKIYVTIFDTTNAITHPIDESDAEIPLSHPCIAVTPGDIIHIAWQQGSEIWYVTNTDFITPENWENVQWSEKYNLSQTQGISEHPWVESYGDIVTVAWKEGELGDIYKKWRYVWKPSEPAKWSELERISNSPELNSDYPQMSTNNVLLWQEEYGDGAYQVFAKICDTIVCLTPYANNVSFAHANALVVDPKKPQIDIYYCYTDEITPDTLYEVKFDKYVYDGSIFGEQAEVKYYEGDVGADTASPYCVERTGYIDYGDYSIDYGNQLEYLLKYLDPCMYYQLQAIVYQDTTGTIRQKFEVEDTLEATVRAYPAIPETINISISPSSYKEDLEAGLEILKTRGAFASVADFKLYEYEVINDSGGGGSGQQSAGMQKLPIPTMLQAPKPNPFANLIQIRFQIPVKTKVDLKIYNSVGRLVNTLINDEINPGYYTMSWNGRDEIGRTQSNGIYFIRLKTEDYDATKKMVLVR
jgi:hypothetical protein